MKLFINRWAGMLVFFVVAMAASANPYMEAGLAATDREWRGDDYATVAEAIKSHKVPLPRLTDPDGQKLLTRFCDLENLTFNRNKLLPLQSRMEDLFAIATNGAAVLDVYMTEVKKGVKANDELTAMMVFQMELAVVGTELIDEFLPTLKKDETYQARMQGLQRMRSGMAKMFVGLSGWSWKTPFLLPINQIC